MKRKIKATRHGSLPLVTIEQICGLYADFTPDELIDLATALLCIAKDIKTDDLPKNKTKEYTA